MIGTFREYLLATVLLIATGTTASTQARQVLRLPLRVHLLRSDVSSALSTTYRAPEVEQLLAIANSLWSQAGIEWTLESVRSEAAPNGAAFDSVLSDLLPRARVPLNTVVPHDSALVPGWNLYLIRDFGQIAGGTFQPDLLGVILAERGMGVDLLPDGRGGRTLAHELGHSLGLDHEICDDAHNIMALSCGLPTENRTLTAAQIETARRQATTGRPSS